MATLPMLQRGARFLHPQIAYEPPVLARLAPKNHILQRRLYTSRRRIKSPLESNKIQWFSIPMSVGIAVVGGLHIYKTYKTAAESGNYDKQEDIQDFDKRPKKRPRVRPDGPW
jgi:hypothetical protein